MTTHILTLLIPSQNNWWGQPGQSATLLALSLFLCFFFFCQLQLYRQYYCTGIAIFHCHQNLRKALAVGVTKGVISILADAFQVMGLQLKFGMGGQLLLFSCNSKPRKPNRCKISQIKFIQVLLLCRSQNKCRLISTLNSKLDAWVTRLTRVSALAETAHRIPLRY